MTDLVSYEALYTLTMNRFRNHHTEIKIKSTTILLNHTRFLTMTNEELIEDLVRFEKYLLKHNEIKCFKSEEIQLQNLIRKEHRKNQIPYSDEMQDVYNQIIKEYKKMCKEYIKIFDDWFIFHYYGANLPQRKLKIKPQIKIISQKEMNTPLEDICGICIELHAKINTIKTCCNHNFGKLCFETWANTCKQNKKVMNCPLCKKENLCITSFKLRKKSLHKVKIIIVEE